MFSVRSITVFCFDLMCICSLICTVYCSTMFAWRIKIFKYVWKKTVDTWGCRSLCRISQLCITAPPLCQSTHQISQYRCDQNVQNFTRFLRSFPRLIDVREGSLVERCRTLQPGCNVGLLYILSQCRNWKEYYFTAWLNAHVSTLKVRISPSPYHIPIAKSPRV